MDFIEKYFNRQGLIEKHTNRFRPRQWEWLAPVIGGGLGVLGSLFGGGKEERTTTTTAPAPFSWLQYPQQLGAGVGQLSESLFGAPSATPLGYAEWHLQFGGYPGKSNIREQASRRQRYQDYLTEFYEGVTYGPSATQEIVEGALPYYQQFLEEQLPLALSPYEEFLGSTPAAEWQTIRGDLGRQEQEAQLAQQQYYSQYGTAGAGAQDWERLQGGYMGELAQQRRLLEAGWGQRQMAAGAGYAGLAGMGPQTAAGMAGLQMMPYDYQQQYLNSLMGLSGQGGVTTQTSPQYTPNWLTSGLQGAFMGADIYGALNPPTPTTNIYGGRPLPPTSADRSYGGGGGGSYNYGGGYNYPVNPSYLYGGQY